MARNRLHDRLYASLSNTLTRRFSSILRRDSLKSAVGGRTTSKGRNAASKNIPSSVDDMSWIRDYEPSPTLSHTLMDKSNLYDTDSLV